MERSITSNPVVLAMLAKNEFYNQHASKLFHESVEIHHNVMSLKNDNMFFESVVENICVTVSGTIVLSAEITTTFVCDRICDIEVIASWNLLLQDKYVEILDQLKLLSLAQALGKHYNLDARLESLPGLLILHVGEKRQGFQDRPMPAEAVCDFEAVA